MRRSVVTVRMRAVLGLVVLVAVGCGGGGVEVQSGSNPVVATATPAPTAAPANTAATATPAPTAVPTDTAATATPVPTAAATPPDATSSSTAELVAVSITRSDCPNGICSRTEIWSDGSVRLDQEGRTEITRALQEDMDRLTGLIEAFPEGLMGWLIEPGQQLLCQPELDDGGRQLQIRRGGRLDIVDTCHAEGPEVDELLAAVSAVRSGSVPIRASQPRPLADLDYIGGCDMGGTCPTATLWTDGRWARWAFERGEDHLHLSSGAVSPSAASFLLVEMLDTDFDALRAGLGPGVCHACVDGINRNVDLHVAGTIVSFSDVEHELEGAPIFDDLFALMDAAAREPAVATIAELNDPDAPASRYLVAGHLVFADECPYCPPGAMCEPCAGPSMSVLSEQPDLALIVDPVTAVFVEQLGPTELALSVNLPNEHLLVAGGRYEVVVELSNRAIGGHRFAEVISFRALDA